MPSDNMHASVQAVRPRRAPALITRDGAAERVAAIDWERVTAELDEQGYATIAGLLEPEECRGLAGLYGREEPFRSRVVMAAHGFGRGEYKYFAYPLPEVV